MTHYHKNGTVTTYELVRIWYPYNPIPAIGVEIVYPCGTRRWISDSWYSDINTDTL